ncbi:MAG TPA: hypothetical protein VN948_13565 [Terriglobales bacterium]|nr:hypothetical protein [Terriglobales bacterium]
MMPDVPEQQLKEQPIKLVRHENFESWYANNVQYHPSEWDLKLIFGELDWRDNSMLIQQHTAISVTWLQAKIMLYFLTIQVGVHEMSQGKIQIPPGVAPTEPPLPSGDLENNPFAMQVHDYLKRMREQFMAP